MSNISNKGKPLDKSRSTQRTETEDTVKPVNKSRSISSASLYVKINKIEKPKEIDISKENSIISGMSVHGESLSSITPDKRRITRNNKRKKTPDTLIKVKEIIKEPENPSKRTKEDSIPDVENKIKNTPTV